MEVFSFFDLVHHLRYYKLFSSRHENVPATVAPQVVISYRNFTGKLYIPITCLSLPYHPKCTHRPLTVQIKFIAHSALSHHPIETVIAPVENYRHEGYIANLTISYVCPLSFDTITLK